MDIQQIQQSISSFSKNDISGLRSQQTNRTVQNQQALGKDDFLQLLVTQLKYQDPSKPMEDTAFISQMAEFSALEQMTNISKGFEALSGNLNSSFVVSLIGQEVALTSKEGQVSGTVTEVSLGTNPRVNVEGTYYSIENISRVGNTEVQ